jgi:hypothetical protein
MIEIKETSFPGLYQSANDASLLAQKKYYISLCCYLGLLVVAAAISFFVPTKSLGALISAFLFLATLGILIYLKTCRPDDIWYNGRAVAESTKTLSWKWMMRADPFHEENNVDGLFLSDLKKVLEQNRSLSSVLSSTVGINELISIDMREVRPLSFEERKNLYKSQRIDDQANWYAKKSSFNKKRSTAWFWISVALHALAISMLLYRIYDSSFEFPIEVVATAASAVLTWIQAKKYNELSSSYSLAAHEIGFIKTEWHSITEEEFSDFVTNAENAFSREHTQWIARKVDS